MSEEIAAELFERATGLAWPSYAIAYDALEALIVSASVGVSRIGSKETLFFDPLRGQRSGGSVRRPIHAAGGLRWQIR
jgi:hypothetical protein